MIIAFARQGQEIGHFPEEDVPALVASGEILPSDDYWHEGLDDWRKVGDRWPVAEVGHRPATPVMRMEDAPTSSRSGFGLVFLLIAALLIAGGAYWYFYLRPAPEEPAAVAQPSEQITEPSVAEPTATVAPVEESVDEQAAAPAPATAPAASEEELALEWLRENPKFQPQTVKLLEPREFTLKRNALVRGSTMMPAGASANVESWDDTTVTAGFAAEPRVLPHAATDFVARVVAVYRQEKDQPAPVVAAAEPTPQEAAPGEPPAAEPEPVEPAPTPAVPTIDKLSVVSWNIEWYPGREPGASNSQAKDHAKVVKKELTKINPDILLAQEIRDWDAFIDLCSTVPDLQGAAVSHYLQGRSVGKQQTAIASKLPVIAAWYDNWKPAEDQPPRGYTAAVVQIPGTENLLLVYSLHLKSNRAKGPEDTKSNYAQREESARQLLAHVEEMQGKAFKDRIVGVIVGGDFNTNHDGQFEDKTVEILAEAGFANTWEGVSRKRRETWIGGGNYEPTTFDYIKGLVRCEEVGLSPYLGSTSLVIWAFNALQRRPMTEWAKVAVWIVRNHKNPYSPFNYRRTREHWEDAMRETDDSIEIALRAADIERAYRLRKDATAERHAVREQIAKLKKGISPESPELRQRMIEEMERDAGWPEHQ